MLLFDKSITLRDKLDRYDKESLKFYARDLGLTKLSQLKKAELVQKIVAKLLEPETMFYRAAILTHKEITVLEKGFNGAVSFKQEEADAITTLNGLDFIIVNNREYIVPCDVIKVWQEIKNDKFLAYHKKASWVWKCLYWAEEMYVRTPMDIMIQLVNTKKSMKISKAELIEIYENFPKTCLWTELLYDNFLNSDYIGEKEELEDLLNMQADKDFYIPSSGEIEEYYETDALLSGKEYRDMKTFLQNNMSLSNHEVSLLLSVLWSRISGDFDTFETFEWFMELFQFESDAQMHKLVALYNDLSNSTRMLIHRGHKPSEIHKMKKTASGKTPILLGGSPKVAKMIREAMPELQRMGYGLDLESNFDNVSAMSFPEAFTAQGSIDKKIYRNDLCPCGSGKKYK